VKPFEGLFGDPSAGTTLAEADLRRVMRRAQRLVGRGVQPAGVAGIRARAADQAELAREIGEALEARDVVRAQALIRKGPRCSGMVLCWPRWRCRPIRIGRRRWKRQESPTGR
jgi:hypothetical protein